MATKTLDSTVSDEVRAAMARRRVSQGELADHLEVSQAAVSRRLSGEVVWSVPELVAIALFLDVTVESLLSPSSAAVPPGGGGPLSSTGAAPGLVTPAVSPPVEESVPGGVVPDPAVTGDASAVA